MFCLLFLHLAVSAVQSLILEGCFHSNLPEEECFCAHQKSELQDKAGDFFYMFLLCYMCYIRHFSKNISTKSKDCDMSWHTSNSNGNAYLSWLNKKDLGTFSALFSKLGKSTLMFCDQWSHPNHMNEALFFHTVLFLLECCLRQQLQQQLLSGQSISVVQFPDNLKHTN